MFRNALPVPDNSAFPALRPKLENYELPSWVLRAATAWNNDPDKIESLKRDSQSLADGGSGEATLRYIVLWDATTLPAGSVDLIVSQAVLQAIPHGDRNGALRAAIEATSLWLRPGRIASHEIDLGLYGMTPWNIHWSWSNLAWRTVRGRRDNFVNREPLPTYVALFRGCGFSIVAIHAEQELGIDDSVLAPRFRSLPESERRTRIAHIMVRKER